MKDIDAVGFICQPSNKSGPYIMSTGCIKNEIGLLLYRSGHREANKRRHIAYTKCNTKNFLCNDGSKDIVLQALNCKPQSKCSNSMAPIKIEIFPNLKIEDCFLIIP